MIQHETTQELKHNQNKSNRCLVIFAKEPSPGKVKTRLGQEIGMANAAQAYRDIVEALIANISNLQCQVVVACSPPESVPAMQSWLDGLFSYAVEYSVQGDGDLGDRINSAVEDQLRQGSKKVIVVGSDCPWVDTAIIEEAFQKLDTYEIVLGPAEDGGYYLIGLTVLPDSFFDGIPWSTDEALSATVQKAQNNGLACHVLKTKLTDIDHARELKLFRPSLPR